MNHDDNLFARFAARWDSDATLLTTPSGERFSYGDALTFSGQVAQFLADAGLRPGDRVSVQAEKSVDYLWLYLGCLRGGFAFHPLNPAYTHAELEYFFTDADPALVVYDPANRSNAEAAAAASGIGRTYTMTADGGGSFRAAYRAAAAATSIMQSGAGDIAVLLYTSGTTGQPKGIPLSHGNIGVNAVELSQAWGFTRDDVLLHALPMFHAHGLLIALNCTLMSGSMVRYLPRFDVDAVVDELPNASVMMGVPTYYNRLLGSERFDKSRCRSIRLFTSGSAPLREDTFREFESLTGHRIVERYGMSETVVLTSNPIGGPVKAGTVGVPLASVEVRIADPDDSPMPRGQIGRIQVRGPNVFRAYWRKPEKTAADFTMDGFFDTGDQGRFDADGYLSIVGRAKDLIISGGLNVYPVEVERILHESDLVEEAVVIGVPHADFGEAVVAIVIADPQAGFDEDRIRSFARERLASFKLPKRVVAVDELPRNAMGKVRKDLLRDRYRDLLDAG